MCATAYLNIIRPLIPRQVRSEVDGALIHTIMTGKLLGIRGQDDPVSTTPCRSDTVVAVRVGMVEVECEEAGSTFEDEDLVAVVFERDVLLCSRRRESAQC